MIPLPPIALTANTAALEQGLARARAALAFPPLASRVRRTRRVKVLTVSADLLLCFCRRGTPAAEVVDNALPEDAEALRAEIDWRGDLRVLVASADFPEVPRGATLPALDSPVFRLVSPPTIPPAEEPCPDPLPLPQPDRSPEARTPGPRTTS